MPFQLTADCMILIVDRLSRNQILYQILVKLNNPRLSYCDLNAENLGAVRK